MELPIDLTCDSPPQFKWKQVIHTIGGVHTLEHSGRLPPPVENAVAALVRIAKEQAKKIEELEASKKPDLSETTFVKQLTAKRK